MIDPSEISNARATQFVAGQRLLAVYTDLAWRGEHLLTQLLADKIPKQWAHYPENDAIDHQRAYQWFYHSHSPEDRPAASEHGHIHLFARKPLWSRRLRAKSERAFAELCGNPSLKPTTRHLLTIGFNAKGLPISLFTVNSWVTGDLMLSHTSTLGLLTSMQLNTDYPEIDIVIQSIVQLCVPELQILMQQRDLALQQHQGSYKLADETLELLSEMSIDLDEKLLVLPS